MARIFYAWEFGANLGHIGAFLPLGLALRHQGHEVQWVVTDTTAAARLLDDAGFTWLQAPRLDETRRPGPPLTYADILLRFGYGRSSDLLGLVGLVGLLGLVMAWRELMRLTGAQWVLADHSPTALLAALFDVAEEALITYPELGHYEERGPARYWGSLPVAPTGLSPVWPALAGKRIFAYLRPETPLAENARAFASKYANFNQQAVIDNLVRRIQEPCPA